MHCIHPRVGVGVLVVRGEQILLGKRCGKHMPGVYGAPGGHLEAGETFADCARREILEETGLNTADVRFLCLGHYQFGDSHYVDVDMVANCPEGEALPLEPDKCQEWKWYSVHNLPSPLFIVTKRMIDAYLAGNAVDESAIHSILQQP